MEISPLHSRVLTALGFTVHTADFLEWAKTAPRFDRVLLNPPFADNRALLHLQAAASVLAPGGRLAAILPAPYRNKDLLPGIDITWSEVIQGAFEGTSVAVDIATLDRPGD